MTYWIYDLPTWLFGIITVLVFCTFRITGLVATRQWAPTLHPATLSHNHIVGYYFGAVTMLYGITFGLLLIGGWSTFTETEAKVDREASTLAAFFWMSATFRIRFGHACKAICAGTPGR